MSTSTYRSQVTRLQKEGAEIQKKIADERKKISRIKGEIGSIERSISSSTSISTLNSKKRQVESKHSDLARAEKNLGDLSSRSAAKSEELRRALGNLERAEEQDRKRVDAVSKKRRDDELRHAREVTRETEKQARIHNSLRRSSFVIDIAKLPEKITVLFLASNPLDQPALRLDEEIRTITEKIRAADFRDHLELKSRWALRTGDFLQALNEDRPTIVHFSGHGSEDGELIFQNSSGAAHYVTKDAIVATIATMADSVRMVVFNACFSAGQADDVAKHVDIAIGVDDAIGDDAARYFASQLYSSIAFGHSVGRSYDQARAAVAMEMGKIPDEHLPTLYCREGVDAYEYILVRPSA